MDAWILWLVVACILGIGEMHQGGFYLAPFAAGAALATVVSLLGVGAPARGDRLLALLGTCVRDAATRRKAPPQTAPVDPHGRGSTDRSQGDRLGADRK